MKPKGQENSCDDPEEFCKRFLASGVHSFFDPDSGGDGDNNTDMDEHEDVSFKENQQLVNNIEEDADEDSVDKDSSKVNPYNEDSNTGGINFDARGFEDGDGDLDDVDLNEGISNLPIL